MITKKNLSRTICMTLGLLWLGVSVDGTVVFEDFGQDPDYRDCDPLCWQFAPCCPGTIDSYACGGIEGLRIVVTLPNAYSGLLTTRSFAGDVTVHMEASFCGVFGHSLAVLHFAPNITGYEGGVVYTQGQWLLRIRKWQNARVVRVATDEVPFNPHDGPFEIELASRGGQIELRAWPVGGQRPDAPQVVLHDVQYRSGSVGFAGTEKNGVIASIRVTEPGSFRRGDANDDGVTDISDPVYVLNHLFGGGAAPTCMQTADANDDNAVDIADPVYVLNHLFSGGPALSAPVGECGEDTTPAANAEDDLSCEAYTPCDYEA